MRHAPLLILLMVTLALQLAPTQRLDGQNVANLEQQLRSGLKARLPREFAFIRQVVLHVRDGRLRRDLVTNTMQWARKKARSKRYPFPYFEFAMRELARRQGINL